MPNAVTVKTEPESGGLPAPRGARRVLAALTRRPTTREALIFLAFCLLTALMTWPWVTRLRDAVVDPGDPYLLSWVMWWDYHQTFHNPLHLFDANIFYPLRYTLAFSENDYGISLIFFPLYAMGLRPLTVNSVATFFGFAFCGYGAFRLTRTLSGSNAAGWVAGIIFAFIPYRFHLLSQVHYVFAGWMPLVLEALVLFARERSRKRAAWLGVAFTMNALSCVSWFILSLTPLTLSALFLIVRYRLARDRDFWVRGAAAMGASALALLPFLLPYHYVSRAYGFNWSREVVERGSPTPMSYLVSEYRNRLWKGFGDNVKGVSYRLFPGLLPLLLALASVLIPEPLKRNASAGEEGAGSINAVGQAAKWVARLDALAVVAGTVAFVSAGWIGSTAHPILTVIFDVVTPDRAILVLVLAFTARLSLAYPPAFRRAIGASNLIDNIRATRRGEAFWVGAIWAVTGFLMSLGMNSWLFRIHFDLVFLFRGMREPSRAAMAASLGLSVLAGLGAARLATSARFASLARFTASPRLRAFTGAPAIVGLIILALLFELRAAPLRFMRGAVYPDQITLRLKETPMRGGLVELPTGGGMLPHLYMLRAADHERPLINAISTFVPPHAWEIDKMSHETPIPPNLLDALEKVPTSYLVIHNQFIEPTRLPFYDAFLISGVASGRLRFVNRFDGHDDLYAVVKTEPGARGEAALPFGLPTREWAALVEDDPVNLLGAYAGRSQQLYRVLFVAGGATPRYAEFIRGAKEVGRGILPGSDEQLFHDNLRRLAESLTQTPEFRRKYDDLDNAQYVERLLASAGVETEPPARAAFADDLSSKRKTRADVLLEVADDPRLVEREQSRSYVVLNYFAFLQRGPGDPPDRDLAGLDFWVRDLETAHNPDKITSAFKESIEYNSRRKGGR